MATAGRTTCGAVASVLALALAVAACSPFAEERADIESVAVHDAADGPASAANEDDRRSSGDADGGAEAVEEPDAGEADGDRTPATNFRDQELDLDDLHPDGVLFQLNEIRFEGNAIVLDAAIDNGHTDRVDIAVDGIYPYRLRLRDDLGNVYNFQVPEGEEGELLIDPGEVLAGEFVFLGPPRRAASELWLVANLSDDELDEYDPQGRRYDFGVPRFVIGPIPLEAD